MATKNRNRQRNYRVPTKIPIHTLSSGVGRQVPTKRLPSEAEEIKNSFVTLEKSVEKRNGFEFVATENLNPDIPPPTIMPSYGDLLGTNLPSDYSLDIRGTNHAYYWFLPNLLTYIK